MIHRVRINKNRLLNPNFFDTNSSSSPFITSATTVFTSGITLTSQWTNSNVFPTLGNPNNYNPPQTPTLVSRSVTFDQQIYAKSITIPIELKFEPMDYSDDIDNWVGSETQKAINGKTLRWVDRYNFGLNYSN